MVCSKLKVDEKLLFIGGFSKGGFATIPISDQTMDHWAGIIILGGGGSPRASKNELAGKPVFLGAGEDDPYLQCAKRAPLIAPGADVTLETFAGRGHSVESAGRKTQAMALGQWAAEDQ